MAIRIYPNKIEFENANNKIFTLEETSNGFDFDGFFRLHSGIHSVISPPAQGSVSGYTAGGTIPPGQVGPNVIDKFPFATDSNATDVGDLANLGTPFFSSDRSVRSSASSKENGYVFGGSSWLLNKFPFATDSNATVTNFIPLGAAPSGGSQSSFESGYGSGRTSSPDNQNYSTAIVRFRFNNDAVANYVSSLAWAVRNAAGCSSAVHAYTVAGSGFSEGITPTPGVPSVRTPSTVLVDTIQRFPFVTESTAILVGALKIKNTLTSGQSSDVSGYSSGGMLNNFSFGNGVRNTIEKFPFATDASSSIISSLTVARGGTAAQSSTVSGYTSGGADSFPGPGGYGSSTNIIDKFPFSTDANASDVGDLTQSRYNCSGNQS